jgi:hypothetical protein
MLIHYAYTHTHTHTHTHIYIYTKYVPYIFGCLHSTWSELNSYKKNYYLAVCEKALLLLCCMYSFLELWERDFRKRHRLMILKHKNRNLVDSLMNMKWEPDNVKNCSICFMCTSCLNFAIFVEHLIMSMLQMVWLSVMTKTTVAAQHSNIDILFQNSCHFL